MSGDLTRPHQDCGQFQRFNFSDACVLDDASTLELVLDKPIPLQVGEEGIIGRKVSIFAKSRMDEALAEGIVGFNFMTSL